MNPRNVIFLLMLSLAFVSCVDQAEHEKKFKSKIAEMKAAEDAKLKAVVQNFYDQLSTTPDEGSAAKAGTYMVDGWVSTPTPPGGPALEGFVKTLNMFHGMIPDLKWEVQEMLVDGNRVIVRSQASGTPNSPEGYFYGVPTNGSKSFDVMTIDIHTVEDGKIVTSYHMEDWITATQQVAPSN